MALTQVKSDGIATGAVTATQIATGAVTANDLEDSGVTAGTYGSSSAIPAITVDAKGRITSASTNAISVESDRIFEGNTSAEAVDTGSDGYFRVVTEGTEALRIDSSQRVGINVQNPARPLDVVSDSGARAIQVRGRSSDNIGLIDFYSNDGATRYATIGAPAASQFAIETGNTEKLRIDSSGRVGIGTTSPAHTFHVVSTGSAVANIESTATESNIRFTNSSADNCFFGTTAGANFFWYSGGAERARITSTGDFRFNSGYGSVATAYGVRAWVNFDGTAATIGSGRGSGNVTSVTDGGTGIYTINFTNAMPDANYAVVAAPGEAANTSNTYTYNPSYYDFSTSSFKIATFSNSDFDDYANISAAVIR